MPLRRNKDLAGTPTLSSPQIYTLLASIPAPCADGPATIDEGPPLNPGSLFPSFPPHSHLLALSQDPNSYSTPATMSSLSGCSSPTVCSVSLFHLPGTGSPCRNLLSQRLQPVSGLLNNRTLKELYQSNSFTKSFLIFASTYPNRVSVSTTILALVLATYQSLPPRQTQWPYLCPYLAQLP